MITTDSLISEMIEHITEIDKEIELLKLRMTRYPEGYDAYKDKIHELTVIKLAHKKDILELRSL